MNWASAICLLTTIHCTANALNPIILTNGLASCGINGLVAKDANISKKCQPINGGVFRAFLDGKYVADHGPHCVFELLQLATYNSATHTTQNRRGVDLFISYNNIDDVSALDMEQTFIAFKTMIEFLEARFGYKKNYSIFGTPYDWRKGPLEPEYQIFCIRFTLLIIKAYTTNQNKKVILIFHSMGSPVVRLCLRNYTQEFKDKYILILISLAGVCGGSVNILDIFTGVRYYGTEFSPSVVGFSNISLINLPYFQPLVQQIPAKALSVEVVPAWTVLNFTQNPWIAPINEAFGDDVLATTRTKNYTTKNLRDYYLEAGGPVAAQIYDDSYPFADNQPSPGVKMCVMHGAGIPTLETIHHAGDTPRSEKLYPSNGNGDGLVNSKGLICDFLRRQDTDKPIITIVFPNHNHFSFLYSPDVLEKIAYIITREQEP